MLTLIRHGQTEANAGGVLQGHLPTVLNTLGQRQAERLAARLGAERPRIERLISSDLCRARETADPIAAALGLTVELDPAWRERGFGDLEGQALGEIEIWRVATGVMDPPGGETLSAFAQRVHDALIAVAAHATTRPGTVGIVTHGGPMRMVLSLLAEGRLPLAPGSAPPQVPTIANASLLRLVPCRGPAGFAWHVVSINDVAHLADLVTLTDAG